MLKRKIDRASKCPFCNGNWKQSATPVVLYESGLYSAVCTFCGSSAVPAKKYRLAIRNWNKKLYYEAEYEAAKEETK